MKTNINELIKKKWFIPAVAGAILLIAAIIILIIVNSNKSYRVIKLEDYEGDVVVNRGSLLLELFAGLQLTSGDSSTTGDESLMHLLIDSDKHMLVTPNTVFKIKATGTENNGKVKIDLEEGKAYFEVENKLNDSSSFDVVTPNATTSIRGTKFVTVYEPEVNTTHVYCATGKVEVLYGKNQVIDVNPGEAVSIVDDTAVKESEVGLDFGYNYDFTTQDFRNQIKYNVFYIDADHNYIYIPNAPSSVCSIMDKHADDIYEFYENNRNQIEESIKTQDRPDLVSRDVTSWFPNEISLDYGEGTKKFRVELCNLSVVSEELSDISQGIRSPEDYNGNVIEKEGRYYIVSGVSVYLSMIPKETITASSKKKSKEKEVNKYLETGKKVYDVNGNISSESFDYNYDDYGNVISYKTKYYHNEEEVYTTVKEYDNYGNIIKISTPYFSNDSYSGNTTILYEYDENQLLIRYQNPLGLFNCENDENGNCVLMITNNLYGLENKKMRIEKTYDSKNNVVTEKQWKEENGKEELYQEIYYEYVYDKNDNILKMSSNNGYTEYEYQEFKVKEYAD